MRGKVQNLRIMVLYDLACEPDNRPGHERWFMTGDDFRDERHVIKALRRNGHTVEPFGIHDDLGPLLEKIKRSPPDLVFNMCESFSSDRRNEAAVMSVLRMHGISHTGATAEALNLCKDKALSKKIVSFHGVAVPRFTVVETKQKLQPSPIPLNKMPWPAICKPIDRDSSEGISKSSVVQGPSDCLERVAMLRRKFSGPVIVEEFVEGRELYIGMLEDHNSGSIEVFPPRELYTGTGPGFVTWRAKWDRAYRKKHGIDSGPAKKLASNQMVSLIEMARATFRALGLSGYARLDLRLRADGQPVFIEANPNPSIRRGDDFASAAAAHGIRYEDLIERIVKTAVEKWRNAEKNNVA